MSDDRNRIYRFHEFTFDVTSGDLRGAGATERLPPQPTRLLAALIERAGEVVSREDLYRALWGERHVDAEHGLNFCIRQLRLALGDAAAAPRMIETVRGRGYRWIARVERGEGGARDDLPVSSVPRPRLHARAIALVAALLFVTLAAGHAVRPADAGAAPVPDAAADAYVEGRYLASTMTAGSLRRAAESFARAIEIAPRFVDAHAAVADLHVQFAQVGLQPAPAAFAEARRAASAALALDADHPGALLARGLSELYLTLDWTRASVWIARAADRDDASPEARLWLARSLSARGRGDEAIDRARELVLDDPTFTAALFDLGWFYYLAGRDDEAADVCGRAAALEPGAFMPWQCLAVTEARRGRGEAALAALLKLAGMTTTDAAEIDAGRAVFASGGLDAALRWAAERLDACPSRTFMLQRAQLLAAARAPRLALAALEDGLDRRQFWAPFVQQDPLLAPLAQQNQEPARRQEER